MRALFKAPTVLLILSTAFSTSSNAQEPAWPTHPLRLIVPGTAGSASDILARIVGEELGNRLGHRFVVENQPGASGRLSVQALARSSPDGYPFGIVATAPTLFPLP